MWEQSTGTPDTPGSASDLKIIPGQASSLAMPELPGLKRQDNIDL